MRYDRGYGRDYGGRMGGMPRYDAMFRGRERHAGPPQGRRGRDAGRVGWRDLGVGPAPHEGWSQHPAPGERDFLGRPYPPQAMDDRPWGLMDQEQAQSRSDRGYDHGFRGGYARDYDRGFRARSRYQMEGRPEDYHPRFLPDSDEAGVDVHRYGRGGDMRYNSSWTRWF